MRRMHGLLAGCLAAVALAQEPPELLRLSVVGPAGWRSRLQPTNLGSMLASAAAETIWRGYAARIDEVLRRARDADEAFGRERARLLDYGGTLHVVAWLEQAEDALHVPRWSAALVAEPDGHTDLAAMAAESASWLTLAGDRVSNAWRDMRVTAPRCHEGRLLLVFASDDDRLAATARAERLVGKPLEPRDVVRLDVLLPPMLGLLRDHAWQRGLAGDLVGSSTQRASWTVGASGPHVAFTFDLGFTGPDRGMLSGLAPERSGVPDLAWLVPPDTPMHFAWQVDLAALWEVAVRTSAGLMDRDAQAWREHLVVHYGCDPVRDVLARLRDEALCMVCPAGQADAGELTPSLCFVVPVRDEAPLRTTCEAMLRRDGGAAACDEEGVLRGTWSGGMHVTIGHGVACFATDARAMLHAEQVLATAAERARPPSQLLDAGKGVGGKGRIDVATFVGHDLHVGLRLLLLLLGGAVSWPAVADVDAEVARWVPMLRQHQLDTASTTARSQAGQWQLRVLW